jgi:hypothetical protein
MAVQLGFAYDAASTGDQISWPAGDGGIAPTAESGVPFLDADVNWPADPGGVAPLVVNGVEYGVAEVVTGLVIVNLITPISTISKTTPIIIDVYGTTVPLRRAWINASYAGMLPDDMVHNGERFGSAYQGSTNNRASISKGYRFTLLRDGGWPGTPRLDVHAVDTQGVGDST